MCGREVLALPPAATTPRTARRFLADVCARWDLPVLQDDLLLAVSELVTNSVLHARTPVMVVVTLSGDRVEVGVRDRDPTPPVVRDIRADLVSDLDTLSLRPFDDSDPRAPALSVGPAGSVAAGRGLHLLEAVSDEWGVSTFSDAGGTGKEVWFTLAVPPGTPVPSSCPCPGSDERTGSGRPVAVHPDLAGPLP